MGVDRSISGAPPSTGASLASLGAEGDRIFFLECRCGGTMESEPVRGVPKGALRMHPA